MKFDIIGIIIGAVFGIMVLYSLTIKSRKKHKEFLLKYKKWHNYFCEEIIATYSIVAYLLALILFVDRFPELQNTWQITFLGKFFTIGISTIILSLIFYLTMKGINKNKKNWKNEKVVSN